MFWTLHQLCCSSFTLLQQQNVFLIGPNIKHSTQGVASQMTSRGAKSLHSSCWPYCSWYRPKCCWPWPPEHNADSYSARMLINIPKSFFIHQFSSHSSPSLCVGLLTCVRKWYSTQSWSVLDYLTSAVFHFQQTFINLKSLIRTRSSNHKTSSTHLWDALSWLGCL